MKRTITILAASALIVIASDASAQRFSVGTNLLDWANFATVNVDAGVAASRYCEVVAGVRYNPWQFRDGRGGIHRNCARTVSAGVRFWPWYVWSGWWASVRLQAEEYSRGGVFDMKYMEEGRSLGAGVSGGYAVMMGKHLNIGFSIGVWGGWRRNNRYSGQPCGRLTDSDSGTFVLPSGDTGISLSYLF